MSPGRLTGCPYRSDRVPWRPGSRHHPAPAGASHRQETLFRKHCSASMPSKPENSLPVLSDVSGDLRRLQGHSGSSSVKFEIFVKIDVQIRLKSVQDLRARTLKRLLIRYMVGWIYSDPYNADSGTNLTLTVQKCARPGKTARVVIEPSGWSHMMML